MKVSVTMLAVAIGLVCFARAAQAEGPLGRGGWDGNDARVSVVKHALLKPDAEAERPGGGWDLNDARVSVVKHQLLKPAVEGAHPYPGGGWDANDARVSVVRGSKLLTK